MTEKEKLCKSIDEFAEAMKSRILQKQRQGFGGWNNEGIVYDATPRLLNKAAEVFALKNQCERKVLVDIANFAMMIWRKLSR